MPPTGWDEGLLISGIIFGISCSLKEVQNVIVKVFLNICLLSRKRLREHSVFHRKDPNKNNKQGRPRANP